MILVADICMRGFCSGNRSGSELSCELMAGRLGKHILRAGKSQSIFFTMKIFDTCIYFFIPADMQVSASLSFQYM